jgi:Flp pilus assembly protein TadB
MAGAIGAAAMSTADRQAAPPDDAPRRGFWLRELPFSAVLILTVAGVAYTSFSKNPITVYWELLAPVIGLVCIGYGWPSANDRAARIRLIATQALHWFAFLLVINMMLLTSVQRVFSSSATGLAIFTLLALGTFTAGVHVLSWQVCLLGLIMALGIPVIAWIENSVLIFVLIVAVAVAIGVVVWWRWHQRRAASPIGA